MNESHLEKYCNLFNLEIKNREIINKELQVVGNLDEDPKYVFFEKSGMMKKSDLFLALIENISVH